MVPDEAPWNVWNDIRESENGGMPGGIMRHCFAIIAQRNAPSLNLLMVQLQPLLLAGSYSQIQ